MKYKEFNPLSVSSKFAICGIPVRADTYKNCSFGCIYCFSNNRKIMEFDKTLQIANLKWLDSKLDNIYNKDKYSKTSFLDILLMDKITWHCGGMSDPFQPIEKELEITKNFIDIANKYEVSILFSTKSDTVYNSNINPNLHAFQLSITNIENRDDLEPNVPTIDKRYSFYKYLKNNGFKVGIRVQPFIPNITKDNIVDMFNDADYFTIEGIKIVPQNKEHKEKILEIINIDKDKFTQMGLLNLLPEYRLTCYKTFIEKLIHYKIPYSIADNDLHYMSSGNCCCGDVLIKKSTEFNNTYMLKNYGKDYNLDNVKKHLNDYSECVSRQLFTSNRNEGCKTVAEFYEKRFDRKSSPFSPKFQYYK